MSPARARALAVPRHAPPLSRPAPKGNFLPGHPLAAPPVEVSKMVWTYRIFHLDALARRPRASNRPTIIGDLAGTRYVCSCYLLSSSALPSCFGSSATSHPSSPSSLSTDYPFTPTTTAPPSSPLSSRPSRRLPALLAAFPPFPPPSRPFPLPARTLPNACPPLPASCPLLSSRPLLPCRPHPLPPCRLPAHFCRPPTPFPPLRAFPPLLAARALSRATLTNQTFMLTFN
ncbi:hypothetical protein B0H14DRAFT_3536999 [Mycena olivaceomarginata]|nr:hypothetical protein B0H14DRAFT_3536999 [Mycena olivaceomarginata]